MALDATDPRDEMAGGEDFDITERKKRIEGLVERTSTASADPTDS